MGVGVRRKCIYYFACSNESNIASDKLFMTPVLVAIFCSFGNLMSLEIKSENINIWPCSDRYRSLALTLNEACLVSEGLKMKIAKVKSVLSLLVCISGLCQASVIKHFEREWNLTLDDLTIQDQAVGQNNIFPYAQCSLATGNERNCTVVLEAFHPDGLVYKNKCFTRFHTDKGTEGVNMLQMRAVKSGKVVFSYADIQGMSKTDATAYLIFRVLDTLTCKYHEGKVFVNVTFDESQYKKVQSDSFWLTSVFPYKDGSIETYLPYKNLCEGGARCKVAFDANGETVGKPVPYLSEDLYYNDVRLYVDTYYSTQTAKDMFVVVSGYKASNRPRNVKDSNERIELKLIYVKADGESKQLLQLKEEKPIVADVDIDREGALSLCWAKQAYDNITTIKCRHYTYNNTDIDYQSSEFQLPYSIKTLKIRRTVHSQAPISALLILTDECQDKVCDDHYYVRLLSLKSALNDVNADLPYHDSHNMEISGLSCPRKNKEISLSPAWNHDGLNVCVSLSCQRAEYSSKKYFNVQRLVRQCFSMKYLDRPFE